MPKSDYLKYGHAPVMREECLALLLPGYAKEKDLEKFFKKAPEDFVGPERPVYLDLTAGCGGHSAAIHEYISSGGKHSPMLLMFDRDPDSYGVCKQRFEESFQKELKQIALADLRMPEIWRGEENLFFISRDFASAIKDLNQIRRDLPPHLFKISGILADLGLSSPQIDKPERGFSYMRDAYPDMRMSQEGLSAADIINNYDKEALIAIFKEYGEEPRAAKIADAIIKDRKKKRIDSTKELADLICAVAGKGRKGHPAKRVFQALRCAVNDEMGQLKMMLDGIPDLADTGTTFAVLSFQSLEDRKVKNSMKYWQNACICPLEADFCSCGKKSYGKILVSGMKASEKEDNPRAKSAVLRAFRFDWR